MRRRLLLFLFPLLALLALTALVPALTSGASRQSAALHADRLADAARFASAAQLALGGDLRRLSAEIDDYAQLYGGEVWLLGLEGQVLHASAGAGEPAEPVAAAIAQALAGSSTESPPTLWPWGIGSLALAVPVGRDSEVIGAVAMQVPTAATRAAVAGSWAVTVVLVLVPMTALVLALWPATRWILRPVRELSGKAAALAAGDLGARAATGSGPPELRGLSDSFNSMAATVGHALARQESFVRDASHQLRGPLAQVRISVENLAEAAQQDADSREDYRDALAGIDRMTAMVRDLLAATELRAEPGAPADVVATLGDGEAWRAAAERAGVGFELRCVPAVVIAPAGGLWGAVNELVDNALRLSEARTIRVLGEAEAPWYRIRVRDDGRGMSAEELTHATERFWRSPRLQNVPGTGMGLGILQQVVTDAGGVLELRPVGTGGLEVELRLRLVDDIDWD